MRRVVGHVLVVLRTLDRCCVFQTAEKTHEKAAGASARPTGAEGGGHVPVVFRTLDRSASSNPKKFTQVNFK